MSFRPEPTALGADPPSRAQPPSPLSKYGRAFRMGIGSAMEYRADFFLSLGSGAFIVIIQCFFWTAVFAASDSPVVYGYTFPQMIAYALIAGLTVKIVSTGFEWEIVEDIKNGGLSKFIVQPIGYFAYRLACFLGRKAVQLVFLLALSLAALGLAAGFLGFELTLSRVLSFVPFSVLGAVLNFLIYYCLSSLAFTMTEVWGVFYGANQAILMLSGGIFPLDVFGPRVLAILSVLPFKYLVFYPANIINGRFTADEILTGAAVQLVWIAVLIPAARLCWKLGMKRYVAAGG